MPLSRRAWLSELSRASAVAGSGVFGLLGVRAARPADDGPEPVVLQVNELQGPKAVGDVLVVRDATDRVLAFSRRCPHLGCALTVSDAGDGFICPCHGSRFDLTGRRVAGPAERDLSALQVVAEAQGRIKIE